MPVKRTPSLRRAVEAGHDQLLARPPRGRPRGEDAVEALLLRVGAVGDRRDVALRGRRAARRDRHRDDDRVGVRLRRLGQPALAPRHEQRRRRQPPPLDRPLPEPVAAGAVAGRGGVEADRARGAARAARRWSRSRGPRAGGARRSPPAPPRAPRAPTPARSARSVRHSRTRAAWTSATSAPARRSDAASSASASRSPAVPPRETSRTSAGTVRPGAAAGTSR